MARTKAFDPDTVLDAAVDAFRAHGFSALSLDGLLDRMGIARQSLYDTFGGKRAVYLQALGRYRDRNHRELRELFDGHLPIREALAQLLEGICGAPRDDLVDGCLLLNAALERAPDDAELAALLRDNQRSVERILRDAIARSIDAGELPANHDAAALARFFVTQVQGLRGTAKADPDRAALRRTAALALRVLD
jgi:TetR/AcrR family transcriptional repressor of nem operon